MELTLTAGCLIKFCKHLTKLICLYNYCFVTLFIVNYNDQLLPLLRQFLLIQNGINKFVDLRVKCSIPCFNNFGDQRLFSFSVDTSKSEALVALLYVFLSA